jgi:plasmid stabilization system protein ParE
MQVRWSPTAAEDFFRIIEYIRQENPVAAQRIARTIYESAASWKSFPNKGRLCRVEGTLELPLSLFRSWWLIESFLAQGL